MVTLPPYVDANSLEAIVGVLAETETGLSNSEIDRPTNQCNMPFRESIYGYSKKSRLFDIFSDSQNTTRNNRAILSFIRMACSPSRFLNRKEAYEEFRASLNQALSFCGLAVNSSGQLTSVKQAMTLNEAEARAQELRTDLLGRGAHPDVLKYCKAELLKENYFHAVLEAVKGLCQRIRDRTGNTIDGQQLIDRAFGGSDPVWVINDYLIESHKMEQTGFVNICKGVIGMFRNPLAHELKIYWHMDRRDAADMLSTLSVLHRRLDKAKMRPRV